MQGYCMAPSQSGPQCRILTSIDSAWQWLDKCLWQPSYMLPTAVNVLYICCQIAYLHLLISTNNMTSLVFT